MKQVVTELKLHESALVVRLTSREQEINQLQSEATILSVLRFSVKLILTFAVVDPRSEKEYDAFKYLHAQLAIGSHNQCIVPAHER